MLVHLNKEFPWSHSIEELFGILSDEGIEIPEEIKNAIILTRYAVHTRYPGIDSSINEDDYNEALKLAEKVFKWANSMIKKG